MVRGGKRRLGEVGGMLCEKERGQGRKAGESVTFWQ